MGEPMAPGGVSKALNAASIRPFLLLIFIVIAWDLAIRLFRIPPYQIPAPADVVVVLWHDWPELMRQAWPTTYATICGFLLSAAFGIPVVRVLAPALQLEPCQIVGPRLARMIAQIVYDFTTDPNIVTHAAIGPIADA